MIPEFEPKKLADGDVVAMRGKAELRIYDKGNEALAILYFGTHELLRLYPEREVGERVVFGTEKQKKITYLEGSEMVLVANGNLKKHPRIAIINYRDNSMTLQVGDNKGIRIVRFEHDSFVAY